MTSMSTMRVEELVNASSIGAQNIYPSRAIELGYNLYLADNEPPDSLLRESARKVVEGFEDLTSKHPVGTPEGYYLLNIRTAATSLARGIARRRALRDEKMRAAREQQERLLKDIHDIENWRAFWLGGVRLILFGGFVWSLMKMLFGLPLVQERTTGTNPGLASLAITFGACFIGAYIRAYWIRWKVDSVSTRYQSLLTMIDNEYIQSSRKEYELAADQAMQAWTAFTGKDSPPPETKAFMNLLMNLLSDRYVEAAGYSRYINLGEGPVGHMARKLHDGWRNRRAKRAGNTTRELEG
jgi:hypothetical protein